MNTDNHTQTSYVDVSNLIQPDTRTPAERWLDDELERRGASEQGAETGVMLRQIALELCEQTTVPPLLVRDLAEITNTTPLDVSKALIEAGAAPRSMNMAVSGPQALWFARMQREQPATPPEPIDYTPGQWFDATTVDLMQRFYESRLPAIREEARKHGYAIGMHGSMRRDLDLIAAPWGDRVSDAETLAHAIAQAACGLDRNGPYNWENKPAGRVATCIPICWTYRHDVPSDGHIDLSVMPAAQPEQQQPDEQLLKFYQATDFPSLVAAMEHHIDKLQAKTTAAPSLTPQHTRKA